MTEIRNILLTGASGFIGSHLFAALSEKGYQVHALTRTNGSDFNRLCHVDDWMRHLRSIDAVVNAVGIIGETGKQRFDTLHHHAPAALFRACARAGVRRVVQISALGADGNAFTPYQLSKKAADDVLRRLDLEWFVLRPSLVYGEGSRSLKLFRSLAALPLVPVIDDGDQWIQPIHIDDLVATVLRCLQSAHGVLTLDLVGPNAMRFVDWLRQLRRAEGGRPVRTVRVPGGLALAAAGFARHFSPMLHPDNLRMLQQGNTADVAPLAAFLQRMPRDPIGENPTGGQCGGGPES
jgi:uncharacterized protein YbjT (DUF2867 family)